MISSIDVGGSSGGQVQGGLPIFTVGWSEVELLRYPLSEPFLRTFLQMCLVKEDHEPYNRNLETTGIDQRSSRRERSMYGHVKTKAQMLEPAEV